MCVLLFKTNLTFFHNILCSLSAAINWSIHPNLQNETLYDGGFGVLESEMARIRLLLNYRCNIAIPAFLDVNILNLIWQVSHRKNIIIYLHTWAKNVNVKNISNTNILELENAIQSIETADIIIKIIHMNRLHSTSNNWILK